VNDWLEFMATVTAYALVAVLGALILAGLWKVKANRLPSWLPLRRLRRISWNGTDILIVFFTMNLVGSLVHESLQKAGFFESLYGAAVDLSTRARELLWSSTLAQLMALGLIVLGLRQMRGTRLAELGLSCSRAGVNIAVGFVLWLIFVPLMEAVQYLAFVATPQGWADEHALNIAGHQPLEISEWLLLITEAVVLAPLLEEIVFRGVLLGWQLRRGWEAQGAIAFFALCVFCALGRRLWGISGRRNSL
jgi:membrane protease YdiL (CAAX protease family)